MRGTPHKHGIRKWSTRNVTSHTPKICHSTVLYTIDIIYACNSFVSWGGTSDKECLQQKKQLIFCLPETGGGGEQYWSCLQKSKYELFCWAFYEKKRKQKSPFSGFLRHKGGVGERHFQLSSGDKIWAFLILQAFLNTRTESGLPAMSLFLQKQFTTSA